MLLLQDLSGTHTYLGGRRLGLPCLSNMIGLVQHFSRFFRMLGVVRFLLSFVLGRVFGVVRKLCHVHLVVDCLCPPLFEILENPELMHENV